MQQQRRTVFLCGAAIVIAGLAAYCDSLGGPFILDDTWNIAANPSIRHLWRLRQVLSPPPDLGVGGRPLYNLSFAVNYALGGTSVWGYHAVNLAIHLLAALTLFGIVRRTLPIKSGMGFQPMLRNEHGLEAHATFLGFAVALLWTVHPLLTESVTYISERSELLMGLFYLLTLYGFIRHAGSLAVGRRAPATPSPPPELRTEGVAGSRRPTSFLFAGLSLSACLLGMATKEVMVTAPVMVFLYDRTFVSGSFREAWRQRRRYYLGLACTWVLLAYLMTGSGDRRIGFSHGVSAWAYAATECKVVLEYLRLAVWPRPLVLDYDLPVTQHLAENWPYELAVGLLFSGTIWALVAQFRNPKSEIRNLRAAGFAGAWIFLTLAPASSFVPVGSQPMSENRMYLPLAAMVALVVMGIHALAGRFRGIVLAALAAVLAFLTIQRNAVYASGLSIWSDTVAKCPQSARARSNLGAALYRAGRKAEAAGQLEEAARLDPGNALTHLMLGNVLAENDRVAEAIDQYRAALRIDPSLTPARERLSSLMVRRGLGY